MVSKQISEQLLASVHGQAIIQDIIPAIAKLRKEYPISICLVFTPRFLQDIFYLSPDLDCTNIEENDIFFDKLSFK